MNTAEQFADAYCGHALEEAMAEGRPSGSGCPFLKNPPEPAHQPRQNRRRVVPANS
jgi:hypothetical protein